MTRERRPFPNVVERSDGRFSAFNPARKHGRYLGVYSDAATARAVVLRDQAAHMQARVNRYLAEADRLTRGEK